MAILIILALVLIGLWYGKKAVDSLDGVIVSCRGLFGGLLGGTGQQQQQQQQPAPFYRPLQVPQGSSRPNRENEFTRSAVHRIFHRNGTPYVREPTPPRRFRLLTPVPAPTPIRDHTPDRVATPFVQVTPIGSIVVAVTPMASATPRRQIRPFVLDTPLRAPSPEDSVYSSSEEDDDTLEGESDSSYPGDDVPGMARSPYELRRRSDGRVRRRH